MGNHNRRHFLKTTGTAAGMSVLIRSTAQSANETIRMGVVGLRGRGKNHIDGFQKQKNVEVIALCDTDENVLSQRAIEFEKRYGRKVRKYTDYKEMLANPDIDTVSIATPNHWHSIMGIWACQAGKDAYVEKPCSHNIYEGRKLVEAARKYQRIVAHGTQSRSTHAFREAIQLIQDGYIGEVYYAKGLCYKWRDTIGRAPNSKPPKGVDYNRWLGPAPNRAYSKNRHHYNWHWHWDYGNGDIGNQGVHEMDVARWGLGVGLPSVVQAQGGHFMFDDDQETPNCLLATFRYPEENKMIVFEVRHWMTNNELGEIAEGDQNVGNIFLGSEGILLTHGFRRGYKTYLGRNREPGKSAQSGENHFENFIQALRNRRQEDLNAEIEEGHLSASMCHLANTAYLVQRTLRFDPKKEKVIGDNEANAYLYDKVRKYRKPFTIPRKV